jgi:hypothetical protein
MKLKKKRLLERIVNHRAKLIENYSWERKPGQPLPTLEDTTARHSKTVREQGRNDKSWYDPKKIRNEQEGPMENDILGDLDLILSKWEDNQHPYYKDIENLVVRYAGA